MRPLRRQTKLCMPVTTACLPHGQNAPRCQMIVYIVALPAVQLMRTVLSPVSMQRSLPCAAESFFVSAWSHSALHGRFPSHTPHPPLEVSRFRESETHPTTLPIALQATPPPHAATRRTPPRCQPSACGWRGGGGATRRRTPRAHHVAYVGGDGDDGDDRDGGDVDHTDTDDGSYTQTCEVQRREAEGGGGGGHGAARGLHQARGWRMQLGATLRARALFGKPTFAWGSLPEFSWEVWCTTVHRQVPQDGLQGRRPPPPPRCVQGALGGAPAPRGREAEGGAGAVGGGRAPVRPALG